MPNTREKLIEFMANLDCNAEYCKDCEFCEDIDGCVRRQKEIIADRLIANGVTVQEWIPASEPPEEHDSIWAKLYGTKSWQPGLFRKCSYDVIACVEKKDGSRRTISIRTYDGKWDQNKLNEETVICWQPMPQPPKEMPEETVYCKDCENLMFSDCYGECAKAYKGIVRPDDSCEHGVRRTPKGE